MRGPEFHHQLPHQDAHPHVDTAPLSENVFDVTVREANNFGVLPTQADVLDGTIRLNGHHEPSALPQNGTIMEQAVSQPKNSNVHETKEPLSLKDRVIERYREFHNFEPHTSRQAHNTLTDALYPATFLPIVVAVHEEAGRRGDTEARQLTSHAMDSLYRALGHIHSYTDRYNTEKPSAPITPRGAFAKMRATIWDDKGGPASPFAEAMKMAKDQAYVLIKDFEAEGYMDPNKEITIKNGSETVGRFGDVAKKAVKEYEEAELGVDLGQELAEKLHDPRTKAIVFSIDINSTLNVGESYATPPLIDIATAELQTLADSMAQVYPDKKLLYVLNTGRPAMYAWGVAEMLPPTRELRTFGVAEGGGVVYKINNAKLEKKPAVENPTSWKVQLKGLERSLLSKIKGGANSANVEEKDSMLSIQILERDKNGVERYCLKDAEEPDIAANEFWFEKETIVYLKEELGRQQKRVEELRTELTETPGVNAAVLDMIKEVGQLSDNGKLKNIQKLDADQIRKLKEEFDDIHKARVDDLGEATQALATLTQMNDSVRVQFNRTAGFVDIGHEDLNKFSTVIREMEKLGLSHDETLLVHIGDSSTDVPPTSKLGQGEANEGVDEFFLVGVGNSNEKLKDAVHDKGLRGKMTTRDAILGFRDTVLGFQNALANNPLKNV